jgi:hypothetical protein
MIRTVCISYLGKHMFAICVTKKGPKHVIVCPLMDKSLFPPGSAIANNKFQKRFTPKTFTYIIKVANSPLMGICSYGAPLTIRASI